MKNQNVTYGNALIIGSILITVTMVLHPAGGSFEHLLKITSIIIITHSVALCSIAVILVGVWGLTKRLRAAPILAEAAFITVSLGTIAAMCAGALNGLALPMFINHFANATPGTITVVKIAIRYNIALNSAFDIIFVAAMGVAIILWSTAILKTRLFSAWFGYFGITTGLLAVIALVTGIIFIDLTGFRIFVLAFVVWIVIAGAFLRKKAEDPKQQPLNEIQICFNDLSN